MAFRIITNVTAYCVVTKQLTKHGGGQSNDESRVVGGSNLASIYSTILSTVSILPRCWETVLRRGTQRHQPRFQPKLVRRWREMRDLFPCSIRFSIPILPFDLRFGKSWLILALIEHRSRRKEEEEEEEENLKQRCRSLSGNRPSFTDLNITIFSTEEVLSFSSLQLLKLILRGNLFTCN